MAGAVVVSLACLGALAAAADLPLGVAPEDLSRYDGSLGKEFVCDGGATKVPLTAVNDDYCDCKDGSDELGTNACGGSVMFYCQNKEFLPKRIPSSFVNDWICDCCDGSDEHGTGACNDTCEALGRIEKEKARARTEMELKGYHIRLEWISEAKKTREEWANRKVEVAALIKEAEPKRDELKAKVEKLKAEVEAEREKQRELLESQLKEFMASQNETGTAETTPTSTESHDATAAGDPAFTEAPEGFTPPPPEVTTEAEVEVEDELPQATQEVPPLAEGDEGVDPVDDDEDFDDVFEDEMTSSSAPAPSAVEKSQAEKDLEEAERELREQERSIGDWEREARDIGDKEGADYGADDVFLPMRGKCLDANSGNFQYTLCPYERVDQNPGSISLGRTMKFNGPEGSKYSEIRFEGGLSCWQGPERSTTVRVLCGLESSIGNVNEPQKCVYTMDLRTPAACEKPSEEALKLLDIPATIQTEAEHKRDEL
eukprot:comp21681_c0_seq1/m.30535 comp21681_c0_seq1/g.30535  ORF comp21681_c0_seq1/g.30535 comp21681_c0_seq1/m.30535 type:complete len:486 (-) comp21681_c0_seq1:412-1869(-)